MTIHSLQHLWMIPTDSAKSAGYDSFYDALMVAFSSKHTVRISMWRPVLLLPDSSPNGFLPWHRTQHDDVSRIVAYLFRCRLIPTAPVADSSRVCSYVILDADPEFPISSERCVET